MTREFLLGRWIPFYHCRLTVVKICLSTYVYLISNYMASRICFIFRFDYSVKILVCILLLAVLVINKQTPYLWYCILCGIEQSRCVRICWILQKYLIIFIRSDSYNSKSMQCIMSKSRKNGTPYKIVMHSDNIWNRTCGATLPIRWHAKSSANLNPNKGRIKMRTLQEIMEMLWKCYPSLSWVNWAIGSTQLSFKNPPDNVTCPPWHWK